MFLSSFSVIPPDQQPVGDFWANCCWTPQKASSLNVVGWVRMKTTVCLLIRAILFPALASLYERESRSCGISALFTSLKYIHISILIKFLSKSYL